MFLFNGPDANRVFEEMAEVERVELSSDGSKPTVMSVIRNLRKVVEGQRIERCYHALQACAEMTTLAHLPF